MSTSFAFAVAAISTLPVVVPEEPAQRAALIAPLHRLFAASDYPLASRRNKEQGTVRFMLFIDPDGSISRCDVIGSSGFDQLDRHTCALVRARARFSPALDAQGRPTHDTHVTRMVWRLPKPR